VASSQQRVVGHYPDVSLAEWEAARNERFRAGRAYQDNGARAKPRA
jgi:putative transposase